MMLPAISARFWAREIWIMFVIAFVIAFVSGYVGLLLSYHFKWPSGPSIVLFAGLIYILSLILGRYGSLRQRLA
jgi:zinc/manganese transport system permease protein